jgi:hypothetical protein
MFQTLIGLLGIGPIMTLIPTIIMIMAIRYRMKFFTVNEFSSVDEKLPEVINKAPDETTLEYACSFTKNNQFYLTNHRIIFFVQSILRGKYFTRYFQINSVKNVEITFKNPYGWLIIAAIHMLFAFIFSIASCLTKSNSRYSESSSNGEGAAVGIFFALSLGAGFYVMLWYYLKGFYLVFDNMRITGLFCRSKEGLEEVLRKFDFLKYGVLSPTNAISKADVPSFKDFVCNSCKSVLTLEADDLKFSTFTCPICSKVNPITK